MTDTGTIPPVTTTDLLPATADLERLFDDKYRRPTGWVGAQPARRLRYRYFTPDDVYEAAVEKLLPHGGRWLDVGGGRDVFPSNPRLAERLAGLVNTLVAVDPSPNVHDNPVAHERHQCLAEEFQAAEPFDLVTLRMVAEHVIDPPAFVAALSRLTVPGGRVVVYTVDKWSPLSLAAWATPFWLHNPLKKLIWMSEERDTFPVAYRMNTRRTLQRLFAEARLNEVAFTELDDARTFAQFTMLNHVELLTLSAFRAVGLQYPEHCLLGVYDKPT